MKKTTEDSESSPSEPEHDNSTSQHHRSQPKRQENIDAIVDFYESGITSTCGKIGIELEHIVTKGPDYEPVCYSQEHGIRWILEQFAPEYPDYVTDAEGDLLGLVDENKSITIEPAAQLEISAGPFENLDEAQQCLESFEKKLEGILDPVDEQAMLIGYHPSAKARDMELIPKRRYKFMNFYLGEIGEYGIRMMRCSGSTQVSIDYSSVEDCLRKMRLAYALVPILALITDNAPVFEGERRPHRLMRTKIWEECDPDRCGIVPGIMEPDFTLEDYAEYVLDTPAILVPCKSNEWCYTEKTFGEIYAENAMDKAALEHALSMFFTDIRLKTYIEMRPADAMPLPFALAYASLIKTLFYIPENLDKLDDLFSGVDAQAIKQAKHTLMIDGYEALVYEKPVVELVDTIMGIAAESADEIDSRHLEPLMDLTSQRVTLADLTETRMFG